MPVRSTRIKTSPGPGVGSGTSRNHRPGAASALTSAFTPGRIAFASPTLSQPSPADAGEGASFPFDHQVGEVRPTYDGDHRADTGWEAAQDDAASGGSVLGDLDQRPYPGDICELEPAHVDMQVAIAGDRVGKPIGAGRNCVKLACESR